MSRCLSLDYENYEIIVLADDNATIDGVKVFKTGLYSPGKNRNIGATVAKGEIFAYIDADAYPRTDWLSKAVAYLQQENVAAVGGPGLTPSEDSRLAKAQGAILSSFLVSGKISSRYKGTKAEESDDIHSVNFVAWKKVIEQVGGWNEQYWPGEDSLICLAIRKAGYKQLLAPDVVVYHHRRTTWKGYLKQIRNYGIHRGFFAKNFPETSRRLSYFLPSLLVLGFIWGIILSLIFPIFWIVLGMGVLAYSALLILVALRSTNNILPVLLGIPLTHLAYGSGFIQGLVSRRLLR